MEELEQKIDYGKELASWGIPEYEKHNRTKKWYILASAVFLILLACAFFSGNFLFAIILIMIALIVILHDGQDPSWLTFVITEDGIIVGKKFYDYDEIKDFSIVYKPQQGLKNIYFNFKNVVKPRLSVSLENMNPLPIRESLLKYLIEDLERTGQSISEVFAKLFKL
ncbi:MAG: hypothetical protein ABIJ83_04570 [Patescibacteria group bacterium]|nr:hypothetical protein [Patescibacteria group bacterium]MBU2081420.1 hypothetical protein [Patescibacteria group bacterium]